MAVCVISRPPLAVVAASKTELYLHQSPLNACLAPSGLLSSRYSYPTFFRCGNLRGNLHEALRCRRH